MLYKPPRKTISPSPSRAEGNSTPDEQKHNISPKKFIEGGTPIFTQQNKNQNKEIPGKHISIPLHILNLREPNFSYVKEARTNKAEDLNP